MGEYLNWSTEEVCLHLEQKGLGDLRQKIVEEEIDGKTLVCLTETMVSTLCRTMRKQVMLLEIIRNLKAPPGHQVDLTVSEIGSSASETNYTVAGNILVGCVRTMTPWPVRYQLPLLPPAVIAAFEAKDRCFLQFKRNSCRNQLIQCLYDDISKFTLYPSSTQYSDVLAALCSKYPYLNEFPSRSGSSSQQFVLCPTLLESLKNKFKKERAPLINVETVAIHKSKFGNPGRGRKRTEDCLENDQACCRTHRDLPHSLPIGEDDATVAKHHQDMIIEYRKLRPDMNMLLDRQQRSWFMRAKDFDGRLRTVDLKAKYPWLCSAQLLLSEMKLRFGKDLDKELHQRMKGMEDKILSLVKLKCKDNFVSEIFAEIECEINESTKRDATFNRAILLFPRLFKESVETLVIFDNTPKQNTPTIAIPRAQRLTSKFCRIILDGQEIVEHHNDVDISLAMSCIFASYFIYDIQYSVQLKNTLLFFEHIIFGVSNKEIPVTIHRMADTLCKV